MSRLAHTHRRRVTAICPARTPAHAGSTRRWISMDHPARRVRDTQRTLRARDRRGRSVVRPWDEQRKARPHPTDDPPQTHR